MHDENPVNPTDNTPFQEEVHNRLQRRTVLAGGVALAATSFFVGAAPAGADILASSSKRGTGKGRDDGKPRGRGKLIDFESIPLDAGTEPVISSDYEFSVLAPWGTPLKRKAPEFSYPPTSAAAQAKQVGIGHDGMWYFPSTRGRRGNRHGYLCINHEFGRNSHVLGKDLPETEEEVKISQAAHGVSVIEIAEVEPGSWEVVPGRRSRRITVNTPVRFSGPAAKSDLLKTEAGNRPLGTVNNCANGYTPWGTYLTCEENFNGYFGASAEGWEPTPEQDRYGFSSTGFDYDWFKFDQRFDLSNEQYKNEENRFGWIVEIDPRNSRRRPVKRTALGRVKHEGVALTIGRGGRAVAYMGDDQRFDYIYKFVSSGNYRKMLRNGKSPLDEGTLYAAKLSDDGSGEWLELSLDNPAVAEKFDSEDEVLTYARLAADAAGATPMDRPEWTTVAPNGDVYCTLTNNSKREADQVDAANPQGPNNDGHIIRWRDSKKHTGTTFEWDIFLLSSDTAGTDYAYGSPDGLWSDPDGRIFIQTDGDQPGDNNDQMLVADPESGDVRRLFTGVKGAEVTGIAVTPDRRTMFVNLQHPGNGDPEETTFPDYVDGAVPRDATIVIRRKDGGIVGS